MRRIICYTNAGLGNRLRSLASCAVAAQLSGRRLVAVWYPYYAFDARFQDIYQDDLPLMTYEELGNLSSVALCAEHDDAINENVQFGLPALGHLAHEFCARGKNHIPWDAPEDDIVVFNNNFVPNIDFASSCNFIRSLKIHQWMQDFVDTFVDLHGIDQEWAGINLRATDLMSDTSPVEAGLVGQRQGFLCSDRREAEVELQSRFPSILTREKGQYVTRQDEANPSWDRNIYRGKQSVLESIIDMYVLAKTDFCVYDSRSTFAQIIQILAEKTSN